ncbi:hypothetical protein AYO49_03400 [Verrucomicrobiaceae bacterium SCGC AG-212-N21]|nr:hypothetical protein AYO49_03400 [Verrucomicrobiaceae bacterium SCGC AG-212-N21]
MPRLERRRRAIAVALDASCPLSLHLRSFGWYRRFFALTISDYIIPQDGLDWAEMLRDWHWTLPESLEVWIVTRFADLIIVQEDGSVWLLDTGGGTFKRIADSKDHFADLAEDTDAFGNWFMVLAVDEMVAAGHPLGPKQCYSFRLPTGLGGDYALSNYMVTDIRVHLSIHGQIFHHTRNLPDGTRVTFTTDSMWVQP